MLTTLSKLSLPLNPELYCAGKSSLLAKQLEGKPVTQQTAAIPLPPTTYRLVTALTGNCPA
jgi:hypothetical protein